MEVVNDLRDFVERLFDSIWRFGWGVAFLLLIGGLTWSFVRKNAAIPAGLGAFWLTWQIYNIAKDDDTPLFESFPDAGSLFGGSFSDPWFFLGFIVSLALAILTVVFSKKNQQNEKAPLVFRILMAISVLLGLMILWRPVVFIVRTLIELLISLAS